MSKVLHLSYCLLAGTLLSFGQVEHNFKRGPEKTDCHKLDGETLTSDSTIAIIKSATFRYQQSMKVSRYRVPNKLSYFSCEGKVGYLVAAETDTTTLVYEKVPIESWRELSKSNDPLEAYRLFKEKNKENILKN